MRHFLSARPVAALARGVHETTGTAVLIARTGGALRCAPCGLRAARAAVALTAIAPATDHALSATASTVEQASAPIHRQSPLPTTLDLRGSRRDTCSQPCLAHGVGTASGMTWRFEPMPCRSSRSARAYLREYAALVSGSRSSPHAFPRTQRHDPRAAIGRVRSDDTDCLSVPKSSDMRGY